MANPVDAGSASGTQWIRRLKYAVIARRIRMLVGALLVLAFFGAIGVGSFALVNGTWTVNPVLSGSMRPGLSVGGVVIGERIPVNSLRVRDVILFRSPNNSSDQVVHRIIHIAKGSSGQLLINTQGDANTVRDPWTLTIRGRYAFRARWAVPLLGYVAVAFQNHRGISIIVAGFVLIVIAFTSVIQSRRRDGDKRKSDAELIAFQEFPISGRHLRRSDDRAPESVQNEIQQSSK